MKIVESMAAMQRRSATWMRSGTVVGLVPTMGALHEGHLSLIRRARKECKFVVVSIYVNPTQFGPQEDLAKYPRPRAQDLALCRKEGVHLVFAPQNLYLRDHSTYVEETTLSQGREGAIRPGHFRGVATVVLKLFNLVRPTKAYFGQKDAQQVDVITRMVRDLDVPVKVVVAPIIRDVDGVALSSRNRYLSPAERAVAVEFAKLVQHAARHEFYSAKWLSDQLAELPGLQLDYADQVRHRLVAAVKIGTTRLLDNERIRTIHPPEGFLIQTRSGKNATVFYAHFKTAKLKVGQHEGICSINGSPISPSREVKALFARLTKYEAAKSSAVRFTLDVSPTERDYTLTVTGLPDLRARIKMKKRGDSVGDLFEGTKLIGRAVIFADKK
jgi:pantoate--beta-alanine ligase